jgi:phenylalanyl-tRNA synthetase beta chain
MRIAYQWLKDYLPDLPSAQEVAHLLTHGGLEVESIQSYSSIKGNLEGVVTGKVLECTQHPNADKLKCTLVDVGQIEPLAIVCGASNVAAGQSVVVALPGTTIYPNQKNPLTIKATTIRGVQSNGMLCAEDEIGIGASHEGIIVLKGDVACGTPASKVFPIYRDEVLEIGLTPNRGDAASHYGVAVDLSALLRKPLQNSPYNIQTDVLESRGSTSPMEVLVDNSEDCLRYTGIVLSNIHLQSTPSWMVNRLQSVGVASINIVVDITNYVMLDTGQPLHAFDYDTLKGNCLRVGSPHTSTLLTLDGVERNVQNSDLAINDVEKPVCLAGVFGGKASGVSENTKRIFLESACFSPKAVRRTALRHGLKTDASFRFERGTDPALPPFALAKAVALLQTYANATCVSPLLDEYPGKISPQTIKIRWHRISDLIGVDIPPSEAKGILLSLGFDVQDTQQEHWQVTIPSRRTDVNYEADIAEEILRIFGFDKVPLSESLGTRYFASHPTERRDHKKYLVSSMLTARGFLETMTNTLTGMQVVEKLTPSHVSSVVRILNPLSENLNILRPELLSSMLESAQYNLNRQQKHLKLFEFGKVYFAAQQHKYQEEEVLGILVSGSEPYDHWEDAPKPLGYYQLIQLLRDSIQLINGSVLSTATTQDHAMLDHQVSILLHNKPIGYVGRVNKTTAKYFDLKQEVWYAQLYFQGVLKEKATEKVILEPDRFPSVRRDLSLVIDKAKKFEEIESIAHSVLKNELREIRLFDVFQGEQLGEGKISYSVGFVFTNRERTLTDVEIDQSLQALITAYENKLNAVIRK